MCQIDAFSRRNDSNEACALRGESVKTSKFKFIDELFLKNMYQIFVKIKYYAIFNTPF